MRKTLRVVFLKDVPAIGKRGDVRHVAYGFAKNQLFPQGLAVVATAGTMKDAEGVRARREARAVKDDQRREALAEQLRKVSLTIKVKVNDEGVLYGGVHRRTIVDALRGANVPGITESMVTIPATIEKPGSYSISVDLGHGKTANIAVSVQAT